jgi:hypothetical protein
VLVLAAAALVACGTEVVELQGQRPTATQPKPACISVPVADGARCVYCGADYSETRACLKCESTPKAGACSDCFWSDLATLTCQSCVDASGTVALFGCDELRSDLKLPTAP